MWLRFVLQACKSTKGHSKAYACLSVTDLQSCMYVGLIIHKVLIYMPAMLGMRTGTKCKGKNIYEASLNTHEGNFRTCMRSTLIFLFS